MVHGFLRNFERGGWSRGALHLQVAGEHKASLCGCLRGRRVAAATSRSHNNRHRTRVAVTRTPAPGIPIAMMPVSVVVATIVAMIVAPVGLSVLA